MCVCVCGGGGGGGSSVPVVFVHLKVKLINLGHFESSKLRAATQTQQRIKLLNVPILDI